MITRELSEDAVEIWGLEKQTNMCIEEVGEFLLAWNKYNRGKITQREYVEEMVDCYIMFSQMKHLYGPVFEDIFRNKVDRLERKIQKAKNKKL